MKPMENAGAVFPQAKPRVTRFKADLGEHKSTVVQTILTGLSKVSK